jgi:hypothetical protein
MRVHASKQKKRTLSGFWTACLNACARVRTQSSAQRTSARSAPVRAILRPQNKKRKGVSAGPSALSRFALALFLSLSLICRYREKALREEEAAAARAVASAHDRERVQYRDAEFQLKRARAAAAAQEEQEDQQRRAAVLQALAGSVAPTVEADPRRVLQVITMDCSVITVLDAF